MNQYKTHLLEMMNNCIIHIKTHYLQYIIYSIVALVLATISHSYVLYRVLTGETLQEKIIFTGPNDGLEQMLPIQLFLYEKFSNGHFFYATDFGLGGDFYTDLGYYYSTSIVFLFNVIVVKILHLLSIVDPTELNFWVYNAYFISIVKSAAAILVTYKLARYIHINRFASFLGGFLFVCSPIYFRFTVFWSFFSDVFIWLPLLILGIEKLCREKKPTILIIAVAISFINNFYFAYYQTLIGAIYFLFRFIYIYKEDSLNRIQKFIYSFISIIIGVAISCVAFFHSARGFLGNEREEYKEEMPLFSPFDENANIFYDNYLVVVLFIAIQAIFTFKLYKNYYFRLFASFTIVLMLLSIIPWTDKVFNGFSAPQKRWHYILTFTSSMLIGYYVTLFKSINLKTYLMTLVPPIILLSLSKVFYSMSHPDRNIVWLYVVPVIMVIGALIIIIRNKDQYGISPWPNYLTKIYIVFIAILTLMTSAVHTNYQIFHPGITDRGHLYYLDTNQYNSELQQHYVDQVSNLMRDEDRLDWRVDEQDNTPMYQNFKGFSLYSSIFDGHIIDFYYNDLKINLKHESISRYSRLQSRANLHALFGVNYVMRRANEGEVPYGFKEILGDDKYKVYENTNKMPFVRVTDKIYNEDQLKTPIDREHAMIQGIVSNELKSNSQIDPAKNLLTKLNPQISNGQQNADGTIQIHAGSGGYTIPVPKDIQSKYKDLYVELKVELIEPISRYQINVNGYSNDRLFQTSKYRTHQDNLMYRIPMQENILIGLSPGKYNVELQGVYGEDYKALTEFKDDIQYTYKDSIDHQEITIDNHNGGYAVFPLAYRDGMNVKVDGKSVEPHRVNYLMTAVKVDENSKKIEISFKPPYFYLTLLISFIGIVASILFILWMRINKNKIAKRTLNKEDELNNG
ncbi:YfhO family protein [Abyssicoccus albus]|uniref:Putative membrane protein YfhO n=1 Tax=Abyssicoccus albus TaxID=1817405 RepID=A0A3N5BS14_9BACL|nr:YfhO family protein [Abyssicoccus albus]RPF57850.1 putative membrane protein YfhO [Abyssicoccus albus]